MSGVAAAPDDPRLSLALSLAQQAGRDALGRREGVHVTWKGPGDRLTETDTRIQSWILREITTRFPQDGLIAEEGESARSDREFVWIVDPLDGTNNYALGIPCFAVSVGIFRHGEPYAGVVYDPNSDFRCWALRGRGAFAGVRALSLAPRPLDAASNVAVRVPVDPDLEPLVSAWLRVHRLRSFGSVALHLAFAALGAIDLVLDHKAALWDLAAGAAILLEAGGRITEPSGASLFPLKLAAYRGEPVPFLAGNPLAHGTAGLACRALLERVAGREW